MTFDYDDTSTPITIMVLAKIHWKVIVSDHNAQYCTLKYLISIYCSLENDVVVQIYFKILSLCKILC